MWNWNEFIWSVCVNALLCATMLMDEEYTSMDLLLVSKLNQLCSSFFHFLSLLKLVWMKLQIYPMAFCTKITRTSYIFWSFDVKNEPLFIAYIGNRVLFEFFGYSLFVCDLNSLMPTYVHLLLIFALIVFLLDCW